MSVRVAVASRDGKFVNEHFGRAERFLIFELDGEELSYLGEREVERCCHQGEHEDSAFLKIGKVLEDCRAVVVSKIGFGAVEYMEALGFEIYEAGMPIEDILPQLAQIYTGGGGAYGNDI